ncbi:hypothetical protein DdX_20654 [Ditylenchus destructor]|uniref:Uncharacterized protein n=1 Tax=Ditylenchus destructor TaxID=166010 RepID=A0AAD4MG84_9BILA|nr:hypothetical protein DdX_20654 [Ditylenchus destructor]
MRRSSRLGEKQTNSGEKAQREPKAKKSRWDDKIPNISSMDNGTMVEAFKFLNYCQLAKNSLVSRRYLNLIRTHRHKFALLDVDYISMYRRNVTKKDPAVIKMFNKEIPSEKYNEMIVRNGYSKQIPLEGRIAGKESAENVHDIFVFRADVHQYPNNRHGAAMAVFYADVELKDDNWPLFQHFFRLLMDPFIYVRSLKLSSQKGVLTLLAGAMTPNRERLHCKHLSIRFNGDTQKSIVWITDHVRCDVFEIYRNNDSNCDEEFLDLVPLEIWDSFDFLVRSFYLVFILFS